MNAKRPSAQRRAYTIRDLAVTLTCLLVAGSLLVSVTGANRSLSKTQSCADNLRQLFNGMTLYVNQYNSYPPHAPYPNYTMPKIIGKVVGQDVSSGWDPNIGFIMTHGLALQPPATDSATGHFIWYGAAYDSLPDICKCPALPPVLLDLDNPEVAGISYKSEGVPLESTFYQYALSYQTSGTCRAACTVKRMRGQITSSPQGIGGRQPLIPDPTGGSISGGPAQPYGNTQRGDPYVYVFQRMPGKPVDDPTTTPGQEPNCYIQAVCPAEVQAPSRLYYLADSRDYRPAPKGTTYDSPPAGLYSGWHVSYGNSVLMGTRHFEYPNVLYMDGRVSRRDLMHDPAWNMAYDPNRNGQSAHWRASTFQTDIRIANIRSQVHVMPVLMVKGWEYFFDTGGVVAK